MLADKQWGFIYFHMQTKSKQTHLSLLLIGWAISVCYLVWLKEILKNSHKMTGKIPLLLQILGLRRSLLVTTRKLACPQCSFTYLMLDSVKLSVIQLPCRLKESFLLKMTTSFKVNFLNRTFSFLQIELEQILNLNQDLAPTSYITNEGVPSKLQKVGQD